MKQSTKLAKLKELGLIDDEELSELAEISAKRPNSEKAKAFKEAELVLYSLEHVHSVMTVKCKKCNEEFQTNYYYNKYCSENCLKEALSDRGLEWNPERSPEERWQGKPPGVIEVTTLRRLRKWAEAILGHDFSAPNLSASIDQSEPIHSSADPEVDHSLAELNAILSAFS